MRSSSLDNVRILVVDDELDAREVIAAVLEAEGAQVASASSSSEGLAVLDCFTPQVILSDIAMPGEDGVTFLHRVRALARVRDVPILAFTAYASDADRERLLKAGFTGYLAKPMDPDRLVTTISQVVRTRGGADTPG